MYNKIKQLSEWSFKFPMWEKGTTATELPTKWELPHGASSRGPGCSLLNLVCEAPRAHVG